MNMTLEDFLDSLDAGRIRLNEEYYKGVNDGIDETLDLIRNWIREHKETVENERTGEMITYVKVDE